jgi:hypothetical protein
MRHLRLREGRILRFGPSWPDDDARLVFDAASGDYWVLDPAAMAIVEALAQGGPCDDKVVCPEANATALIQVLVSTGLVVSAD